VCLLGSPFTSHPSPHSFQASSIISLHPCTGGGARRTAGVESLGALVERVVGSVVGSSVVEYEVELGYDDLPLDQVGRGLGSIVSPASVFLGGGGGIRALTCHLKASQSVIRHFTPCHAIVMLGAAAAAAPGRGGPVGV
jgi:hypothetical protein